MIFLLPSAFIVHVNNLGDFLQKYGFGAEFNLENDLSVVVYIILRGFAIQFHSKIRICVKIYTDY